MAEKVKNPYSKKTEPRHYVCAAGLLSGQWFGMVDAKANLAKGEVLSARTWAVVMRHLESLGARFVRQRIKGEGVRFKVWTKPTKDYPEEPPTHANHKSMDARRARGENASPAYTPATLRKHGRVDAAKAAEAVAKKTATKVLAKKAKKAGSEKGAATNKAKGKLVPKTKAAAPKLKLKTK